PKQNLFWQKLMFYGILYYFFITKEVSNMSKKQLIRVVAFFITQVFLLCGVIQAADSVIENECLSPYLQIEKSLFKNLFYAVQDTVTQRSPYVLLRGEAKPVSAEQLSDFINRHQYFQQAYYHEHNPSYPTGCGSFSYLIGEKMVEELGDVYLLWSAMRDHYYLSLAVNFPGGITEEVIVDYTADQAGNGNIAPLIATRSFVKKQYPGAYPLYYSEKSLIMKLEDMKMDNFYLEFIQIWELTMELKAKGQVAAIKTFSESSMLPKRTTLTIGDFPVEQAV
ncbi:MAG: hypothetical protein V1739_02915, partial [Candidatus Omnitrophota bacterium]